MMKVAVIGTGTLGPSIAQVFAQCDKVEKVYICKGRHLSGNDVNHGKDIVEKAFTKLVSKGKITEEQLNQYLSKVEAGGKELAVKADFW